MVGKIVRIIPDLNEHTKTSTVSENGRYRIPNDNPFVKTPGARKEIWAYGLRNPHRLTFAVDPANAANNRLVASICGLNTWEMISIIHKGANYGFPLREGNRSGDARQRARLPLPADDRIPVMINDTRDRWHGRADLSRHHLGARRCAAATAPAAAISTTASPFPRCAASSSTTTSRPAASGIPDYKDMLAADDGNPKTMAKMYEVKILWNDPPDSAGKQVYDTMMPIVAIDVPCSAEAKRRT